MRRPRVGIDPVGYPVVAGTALIGDQEGLREEIICGCPADPAGEITVHRHGMSVEQLLESVADQLGAASFAAHTHVSYSRYCPEGEIRFTLAEQTR